MSDGIRVGPRPLAVHLSIATSTWLGGVAGLVPHLNRQIPWSALGWPEFAQRLDFLQEVSDDDRLALSRAVAAEAEARFAQFADGIRAYWAHPYRRRMPEPPCVWRQGTTRLLAFDGGAARATALLVPSLVNRADILDLAPDRSLVRFLESRGVRALLVDWGAPGPVERGFGLDRYIADRLEAALEHAAERAGGPVAVIGYCMGGLLALALAARRPDLVSSLTLLATPWEFGRGYGARGRFIGAMAAALCAPFAAAGELPVDLLQGLFAAVHPTQVMTKFRKFAALAPDSGAALQFVQVEDWVNDGVPLAAPVALECFRDWFGDNLPGRGQWHVAGTPVRLEDIAAPALVVNPARDRIVPPESTAPLAEGLANARLLEPRSGHIGLVVGGGARTAVWEPLADWLLEHAAR